MVGKSTIGLEKTQFIKLSGRIFIKKKPSSSKTKRNTSNLMEYCNLMISGILQLKYHLQ